MTLPVRFLHEHVLAGPGMERPGTRIPRQTCILASENAEKPAKFLMLFPALAAKNLQKSWAKTCQLNPFSVDRTAVIRAVNF